MQTKHIIWGGVALIVLNAIANKRRLAIASNQITEARPINPDPIGTMWDQYNGATFWNPAYPNLAGYGPADPGRIGLATTGINAGWTGNLQ